MKNITVEPEQLISCAVRMENQNQEYERDMRNLFDEVDRMQSSWQGRITRHLLLKSKSLRQISNYFPYYACSMQTF